MSRSENYFCSKSRRPGDDPDVLRKAYLGTIDKDSNKPL